ncbi:MAG TPA: flagellar biosynthesis anti-sigma factor FlgM [Caldimonas sp.]
MKIGHPADKPLPATAGTPAAADTAAKPAHGVAAQVKGASTVDASATVALSSTASALLSGGTSSDLDAEKVGRVGDAIAAGTFKINPEAIADKLIANAQELLTKVQG